MQESLQVLLREHEIKDHDHAQSLKITKGEIKFEEVTFTYNKYQKIFNKLNITIKGGEKVGLVGLTGSGKTTFINLILRCFDIETGRIYIDSQDIRLVTQKSLREQVAIIPQKTCFLNRSIKENICYGKVNASEKEMIEASKIAHTHEFIEKLPNKYDTIMGENGFDLSIGQQQRIALARALIKDAPIIIFDEPTSSLDLLTEEIVKENIFHKVQNKTILIIAHKYATLAGVDRILVFHNGKIIEDGTKEQLIGKKGMFFNLWNKQKLATD